MAEVIKIKRFVRKLTVQVSDGSTKVLRFLVPRGFTLEQAQALVLQQLTALVEPIPADVVLSPDCGQGNTTPPPTPTQPQFRADFAPSPLEAGGSYSFPIAVTDIINLPAGVSVIAFARTGGTIPYLTIIENRLPTELFGDVPQGATQGTVQITAKLSNGQNVVKDFTLTLKSAAALYGAVSFSPNNMIVRVGPDSTADTRIQLVSVPPGYGYPDAYSMTRNPGGDQIDAIGKKTYFTQTYPKSQGGYFVWKVTQAGQTLYAPATYDPTQGSPTVPLVFTSDMPQASDMLGDIMWVVNADRTATASVTASKAVEITPPRLSNAPATAYVGMGQSGSSYNYTSGVLASSTLQYIGTYRLAGTATEKSYSFTVAGTVVLAVDRSDYGGGNEVELRIKTSVADGLQTRSMVYNDDGSEGFYTDWFDTNAAPDASGYQYQVLSGFQQRNGPLYKTIRELRPTNNPSAVVRLNIDQLTSNQARRTIYPSGGNGGARQRTIQNSYSGPGQNGQLVSENPMFSASFNRYDADSNTYFVNYVVNDPPGDGYEWRLFQKDRFYTIAQASSAGLPPFRDNQVLLIRVNPNTAQSGWRNQGNPNFYSLNLSTRYD